jgi:serine/tyrosine/threonine adenylyltransferase
MLVAWSNMKLSLEHTYASGLPEFHAPAQPAKAPAPRLVFWNRELGDQLGLDQNGTSEETLAATFSGNELPEDARPIAQTYAGHQFGHFSPQLGDGRALLLGEIIDKHGNRFDLAFKGSGRTAFSRGGDGKAALGPMLREVLIGESLHALGIPTTRALAVTATGDSIWREGPLPGAVLARVASSHIRVGTFEFFAARGETESVRKLAEYAIRRHDPTLADRADRHIEFLRAVAQRQARLVAQWMNVGFIHGVMNTDNMAVSGESIDFGPCAFMEGYDPATVFSSIDHDGRYAYANQGKIAQWNLARLCETFLPFLSPDQKEAIELANGILDEFTEQFDRALSDGRHAKLGLSRAASEDEYLLQEWLALLQAERVDWTSSWRFLSDAAEGNLERLRGLFGNKKPLDIWLERWNARCRDEELSHPGKFSSTQRAQAMRLINPVRIPRNHLVEEALTAASSQGDLEPFLKLLEAIRDPYSERPEMERFAEPAPSEVTACYRTFCGT